MNDSGPKVEYFWIQNTSARMKASIEMLFDRISIIRIVEYKMDQSLKPAIHFIYLRFKSTSISRRDKGGNHSEAKSDFNRYLANLGRWKDMMMQLAIDAHRQYPA